MLSQLQDLRVAARTSAFSFKGKDADVRDIARSLGVATILEGSVQRSGEKVRITAQLIEAQTGFHLWSQAFDRDLDDIFLVQDEIAANVADALQDEGDEMLWRAQALAPQEPWTRGLELEKYLRTDSYERAAILAEGLVRDSVENRGDAFEIAVVGYVSSMIELDKADVVASFFESLKPGISGIEYVPMGRKEGTMRLVLVQALVQMGSFETANSILDSLMARMDTAGTDWRDNNYVMATIAAAQGDRESAIDYALKDFDQPLGRQMGWSFAYQHVAWLKPLLKDARVAKRIAELELETQAAGDEVRLMLMQQRAEKN